MATLGYISACSATGKTNIFDGKFGSLKFLYAFAINGLFVIINTKTNHTGLL